jgi:hypothetical protein
VPSLARPDRNVLGIMRAHTEGRGVDILIDNPGLFYRTSMRLLSRNLNRLSRCSGPRRSSPSRWDGYHRSTKSFGRGGCSAVGR